MGGVGSAIGPPVPDSVGRKDEHDKVPGAGAEADHPSQHRGLAWSRGTDGEAEAPGGQVMLCPSQARSRGLCGWRTGHRLSPWPVGL